jgi:hypothetical protein
MSSPSTAASPRPTRAAAQLFQLLWDEVGDLVGNVATAALLQRALKRASAREPGLEARVLRREGVQYGCLLPASWHDPRRRDAVEQLRRLVRHDLHPLFRELSGPVIARRLAQAPELVGAGLAGAEATA